MNRNMLQVCASFIWILCLKYVCNLTLSSNVRIGNLPKAKQTNKKVQNEKEKWQAKIYYNKLSISMEYTSRENY